MRIFLLQILLFLHELHDLHMCEMINLSLMINGYIDDHFLLCKCSCLMILSFDSFEMIVNNCPQLLLPPLFNMLYIIVEIISIDHEDFFNNPFFFTLMLLDEVLYVFSTLFDT